MNNCWIINQNHDIFLLLCVIKPFINRSCPFLFEAFTNTFQNRIRRNFQINIFQRGLSKKIKCIRNFLFVLINEDPLQNVMTEKTDALSYLISFRFASTKPQKHGANDNSSETPRFVCCLKINT